MAEQYIQEKTHFTNIVFISRGTIIEEIGKDNLQMYDQKSQEIIMLPRDNVCFAGVSDIAYSAGRQRELKRSFYLSYMDFRASGDCYGIDYYSAQNGVNTNSELLFKDTLALIDVGNESEPKDGSLSDRPYMENANGSLSCGYQGKALNAYRLPEEIYNQAGNVGERFLTNRFSYDQMEYRFSGLPAKEALAVIIDGIEWWHTEKDKRIFDLEIITNDRTFWVRDIDPYLLSYFAYSENARVPYRLLINLPPGTSKASVIFHNKEGCDVATCNAIGIVKR